MSNKQRKSLVAVVIFFGIFLTDLRPSRCVAQVKKDSPRSPISEASQSAKPTSGRYNGKIVFSSDRHGSGLSIWTMNPDGSMPTRLTDDKSRTNRLPSFTHVYDVGPVSSPDGSKILFNGYRDFNGTRNCFVVNCSELFVMNADGSNDGPLTNDPNRDRGYAARWSPDGQKIVASRSLGTIADVRNSINRGTAIIVMNADGSNQVNISNRGQSDFNRGEYIFVDTAPDWQPLLVPPTFAPSVVGFSAPSYSVYEDAGNVRISVTRTGNLNEIASCFYVTLNDTATAQRDYGPVLGTLRFAVREASKTIPIPITNNADARGSRSFKIVLSDNEGNATFIGGNKETTVTILDKDTVPRPANPIDDAKEFVRMHYIDFLNREPDEGGWDYWANQR